MASLESEIITPREARSRWARPKIGVRSQPGMRIPAPKRRMAPSGAGETITKANLESEAIKTRKYPSGWALMPTGPGSRPDTSRLAPPRPMARSGVGETMPTASSEMELGIIRKCPVKSCERENSRGGAWSLPRSDQGFLGLGAFASSRFNA